MRENALRRLPRILAAYLAAGALAGSQLGGTAQARHVDTGADRLGLVVPLGPILYRVAYQPLADASVLVLFIISMAAHYALTGLGLVFFGGEGLRSAPFSEAKFQWGVLIIAQSLWVLFASLGDGRPVGILRALDLRQGVAGDGGQPHRRAAGGYSDRAFGEPGFLLAAFIGAVSGILISPITTIYYDTGFLISLKGFVGAILGAWPATRWPFSAPSVSGCWSRFPRSGPAA